MDHATPINHVVANVLPAAATIGAVMSHLPDIVSVLVGCAALFYYYLVITKLLKERRDARLR